MYLVMWGNTFFAVKVAFSRKRWLYPGLHSEVFLFQPWWCRIAPWFVYFHTFSLFYHWYLIPSTMMLFTPGMSAMADFSVSPLLVAEWCSLIRVPKALLVSPMYYFPQLQGTQYTTHQPCLKEGQHPLTLVIWCLSVEIVVNAVLMSHLLRILFRSSSNPDTLGRQILCFGFSFSCSLFLCLCWPNYVHRLSIRLQKLLDMFHLFPDIFSYSHCSGTAQHAWGYTLLTCWEWWEV